MAHEDDIEWLRTALAHAAAYSDDPRTQNGAVIVAQPGGYPLGEPHFVVAANCFPVGGIGRIQVTDERLDPATKLTYMEHAERGAIYRAAAARVTTWGSTMYCPWFACVDCARAIICSGIKRVVGLQKPRAITPERWRATIAEADELLREAGIVVDLLDVEVGVEILFNGEKVTL
jgi:deoxycytidylate deaminase